jgi:hypothetical protein
MPRYCWARGLSGCSPDVSAEHFVSKALFPNSVTIQGFKWCKDQPKTVGINSLAANVLCRSHNSALSELDAEALRVWNALKRISDRQAEAAAAESLARRIGGRRRIELAAPPQPLHVQADGSVLERWAFKMMIGVVAGGTREGFLDDWTPPEPLAQFVFGQGTLPRGCGLGIVATIGERVEDWDHVSFDLIRSVNASPPQAEGFLIGFRGLRLAGSSTVPLASLHTPRDFANPEQVLLRPRRLTFEPAGEIALRWTGP